MKAKEALADLTGKKHDKFIVVKRGSECKLKTFKGSKPPESKFLARGTVMKSGTSLVLRPATDTDETALRECEAPLKKTLKADYMVLPSAPPPGVPQAGQSAPPIYNTDTDAPIYHTNDGAPIYNTDTEAPIYHTEDNAPIYHTDDSAPIYNTDDEAPIYHTGIEEAPIYNTGQADLADGAPSDAAAHENDALSATEDEEWEKLRAFFMGNILARFKEIDAVDPDQSKIAYPKVEYIHKIIRVKPPITKRHLGMLKKAISAFQMDHAKRPPNKTPTQPLPGNTNTPNSAISGKEIETFNLLKTRIVKFADVLRGGPQDPEGVQYYLSLITEMAQTLQRDAADIKKSELALLIKQHNNIQDYIKSHTKQKK